MNLIAFLHLCVGTCAVIAGFASLLVKKGGTIHRGAGLVFLTSMLLLCLSGFYLSYSRDLQFTFLLSAFALYLLVTGWLAVRELPFRATSKAKVELACSVLLCTISFLLSALGITFNWSYPGTEPPYEAYGCIGFLAAFCVYSDVRQITSGPLNKTTRVKRHLTRIGSSMLIATIVFFLGNNHVLPEALRTVPLLVTPIITVFVITVFYRIIYGRLQRRK